MVGLGASTAFHGINFVPILNQTLALEMENTSKYNVRACLAAIQKEKDKENLNIFQEKINGIVQIFLEKGYSDESKMEFQDTCRDACQFIKNTQSDYNFYFKKILKEYGELFRESVRIISEQYKDNNFYTFLDFLHEDSNSFEDQKNNFLKNLEKLKQKNNNAIDSRSNFEKDFLRDMIVFAELKKCVNNVRKNGKIMYENPKAPILILK